jgi:hypothetical protein
MNSEDANGTPKSAADLEKEIRKALKDVELQAKRGEITPSEADSAADALGGRPFAENLNDDSFDVFSIEYWPLAMALTWIIWRTNAATREVCPEYRSRRTEWKSHKVAPPADGPGRAGRVIALDGTQVVEPDTLKTGWSVLTGQDGRPVAELVSIEDVRMNFDGKDEPGRLRLPPSAFASESKMSFDAAKDSLWGKLQLGELPAIHDGTSDVIPNLHWNYLLCADVLCGYPDDVAHKDDPENPLYRSVRVPSQRVLKLWPAQDSVEPSATVYAAYEGSPEDALIPVKSEAIREAIMAVYVCADEQNAAIPNNREMTKFVKIILERQRGRANSTLVEKLAVEARVKHNVKGGRYERLFCGPGDTAARKRLAPSRNLIV